MREQITDGDFTLGRHGFYPVQPEAGHKGCHPQLAHLGIIHIPFILNDSGLRKSGDIFGDRILQTDLSVFNQLHHANSSNDFTHGHHAIDAVPGHRDLSVEVSIAEMAVHDDVSVLTDDQRCTCDFSLIQPGFDLSDDRVHFIH